MFKVKALIDGEYQTIDYANTFNDALRIQLELLVSSPELLTDIVPVTVRIQGK